MKINELLQTITLIKKDKNMYQWKIDNLQKIFCLNETVKCQLLSYRVNFITKICHNESFLMFLGL